MSMVMPCSRSATRPSTSRLKSGVPAAVLGARSSVARWSACRPAASHSRRPISVDLPSSTEPQVSTCRLAGKIAARPASRRAGAVRRAQHAAGALGLHGLRKSQARTSEVSLLLLALHGTRLVVVDQAALAFRNARRKRFVDNASRSAASDSIAAVSGQQPSVRKRTRCSRNCLARLQRHALIVVARAGYRCARASAVRPRSRAGRRRAFAGDVAPDVLLRPVGERKDTHRLAGAQTAVEQPPHLRALAARLPAVALRAEREHALLRTRGLLIAARAAEGRVEPCLSSAWRNACVFITSV